MSKGKILIAEDETVLAFSLQDQLEQIGYEVVNTAMSGEEAIKQVKESLPDLIMMDIILQGEIDGVETAQQIQFSFDIPIVYVTAHSDQAVVERAKLTQPFGYLIKPVQQKELEATIEMALYKHQADKKVRELNDQLQQEIKERKQVEEALRESEKCFKQFMDQLPGVASINNPGECFIYANQHMCEVYGLKNEEILGRKYEEFVPPDFLTKIKDQDQKVVSEGCVLKIEETVPDKLGPKEWLTYKFPIYQHDQHTLVGLISLDITEKKQTEKALRESEERFRLAFENANIGMCLVDLDGRFIRVNSQMCEIFGYSPEELESRTVNDITHPEDVDISPKFIQQATSGEVEHAIFEKRYFHKQGHLVWGRVSSSLVQNIQSGPMYFISHVQSITEQKLAEEALQKSEERLQNFSMSTEDT